MRPNILTLESADAWVAEARSRGLRIGFTCGAFDLLHAGHVDLLERARRQCDRLLVAVNSDESIRTYKNPFRPVNRLDQRMLVVAGLASVDAVVELNDTRPLALLERWRPDLYIKGGDYAASGLKSAPAVEAYGGEAVMLPFRFGQSTTAIMERIAQAQAHVSLPIEPRRAVPARVVFLDRDGTLIRHYPYLHAPDRVELLPGVGEGLAALQATGYHLAIVTNQQGIGLGYFSEADFFQVNLALFRALAPHGVVIEKIYFCPHGKADSCRCRKPGPALIERGLKDFSASASACWMVGDSESDIQAGQAAGCRTLRVDASGFAAAVAAILAYGSETV